MEKNKKLICHLCKEELKPAKTFFEYLGHSFHTDVLKCPQCGQVFIPEELAKGRMADVEMQLEDK
ncbi:MAG: DVU_1557 family redox protein [Dehalobacterium sp.]